MRRRPVTKIDENQPAIVAALKAAGCGVVDLSSVGNGCPDLLVEAPTWPHAMTLLEVKNPTKPKADRELTPAQVKFHAGWRSRLVVVETVDEALRAVGVHA